MSCQVKLDLPSHVLETVLTTDNMMSRTCPPDRPGSALVFPQSRCSLWDPSPTGEALSVHLSYYRNPRLVLSEKTLRLAHRHARQSNKSSFSCFLLGTVSVDLDEEGVAVTLDRFDPGREQSAEPGREQSAVKVPSALAPGDVCVPCVFVTNTHDDEPHTDSIIQSEAQFHDAFKVLHHSLSVSRETLELSKVLCVRSEVSCRQHGDRVSFCLRWLSVLPATTLDLVPIRPVPLIPTALVRNLTSLSRLAQPQHSSTRSQGFLTMDQNRKLLLMLEMDPKACSLPLVGVWLSGVTHIWSPRVWLFCLRFLFSAALQDRVMSEDGCFLVVLFSQLQRQAQFYQCHTGSTGSSGSSGVQQKMEYQLLTSTHTSSLYQHVEASDSSSVQCELTSDLHNQQTALFAHTVDQLSTSAPPPGLSISDQDSGVEDGDLSPRPSPKPHPSTQQTPRIQPLVPELSLLLDGSFLGPSHTPRPGTPTQQQEAPPPPASRPSSLRKSTSPFGQTTKYGRSPAVSPTSSSPSNHNHCQPLLPKHPLPSHLQSTLLHPHPAQTPPHHPHPAQTPSHHPHPAQTPPHHPHPAQTPSHHPHPAQTPSHHPHPAQTPSHHPHPAQTPAQRSPPCPNSYKAPPPCRGLSTLPKHLHSTPASNQKLPCACCSAQTHDFTPIYHCSSPAAGPAPPAPGPAPPSSPHQPPPPPVCPCTVTPDPLTSDPYRLLVEQDRQLKILQAQIQMLLNAQSKPTNQTSNNTQQTANQTSNNNQQTANQTSNNTQQTANDSSRPPDQPIRSTVSVAVGTGASLFWGDPVHAPSANEQREAGPSGSSGSKASSSPASSNSRPLSCGGGSGGGAEESDSRPHQSGFCSPSPHPRSGSVCSTQSPVLGESASMYQQPSSPPPNTTQQFYHHLLNQVNSLLHSSEREEEEEEEEEEVSIRRRSREEVQGGDTGISSATFRQLQQLGVPPDLITMDTSSIPLASISPAALASRLSPPPEPPCSAYSDRSVFVPPLGGTVDMTLEWNAIALRRVPDSQLNRLLPPRGRSHSSSPGPAPLLSPPSSSSSTQDTVSSSNMSLATRKYMRRYGVLEEEPEEEEEGGVKAFTRSEVNPLSRRPIGEQTPKRGFLLPAASRGQSAHRDHGSMGNFLDISRLRQLPKLF